MADTENMNENPTAPDEELPKAEAPKKAEKKAEKKADKKAGKKSEKKPSIFARIGRWFRDIKSELKKILWPTPKETAKNTVIVIIMCIIVGVCIWLFDALASGLISALINLVG